MRFMHSIVKAVAAVSLAAAGFTAAAQSAGETGWEQVQRTKVLRVGVIADAIPYFHKDLATGKWDGFGPDFADSLGKSLGAKVQFVETTWGNAVLDLQSNKIDVMFGLAPTPERAKAVDFSDTLFVNTYTSVCNKANAGKSWADLNNPNVKISVDVGSSNDMAATKMAPNANIQRFDSQGAATLALQSGRVDCQVLVILLAQPMLVKVPDAGTLTIPEPFFSNATSIGLRKESDPKLREAVNKWLADARSRDEIKSVILSNMQKLVGVKPESFPANVKF
ncbi:MAG TPA: transporter substrate-binding domain-containing protein [Bordetella sp.]